jgi:xanthine dehydrogenase YagR molybdenum-binding subunit
MAQIDGVLMPVNDSSIGDSHHAVIGPSPRGIQDVGVIIVPEKDDFGMKGIGELGNVGTAVAVANAVYHATGIRVRRRPIRLQKLLAA